MSKWNFLLDENMVVGGVLATPPAARDIWRAIARNSHRCVVSQFLCDQYWKHLKQQRDARPTEATLMAAILNQILHNTQKTVWVDPQASAQLSQYVRHINDKFLADIAAEIIGTHGADNCILVSEDRNTVKDFNRAEMRQKGIQGKRAKQGVVLASHRCD